MTTTKWKRTNLSQTYIIIVIINSSSNPFLTNTFPLKFFWIFMQLLRITFVKCGHSLVWKSRMNMLLLMCSIKVENNIRVSKSWWFSFLSGKRHSLALWECQNINRSDRKEIRSIKPRARWSHRASSYTHLRL